MKRSTVFDVKNNAFFSSVLKNKLIIIPFLVFVLGIVLGCVCYFKSDVLSAVSYEYIDSFISARENIVFLKVFFSAVLFSLLFLILIFIFGTSLIGTVMSPLVLFIRGMLFGSVASLLYSQYGIKGIAFYALLIVPPAIIMAPALMWAVARSIGFSLKLVTAVISGSSVGSLNFEFKKYCIYFIWLIAAISFAALCDSVLSSFLFDILKF